MAAAYEIDHSMTKAVLIGNRSLVARLLSKGNSANRPVRLPDGGLMPLVAVAASYGHREVVALLLDKQANVDATCSDGETAMMLASKWNHLSTSQLLLDRGAAVNHATPDGMTSLLLTCIQGNSYSRHIDAQSDLRISMLRVMKTTTWQSQSHAYFWTVAPTSTHKKTGGRRRCMLQPEKGAPRLWACWFGAVLISIFLTTRVSLRSKLRARLATRGRLAYFWTVAPTSTHKTLRGCRRCMLER
jgi:ankyrin repeat protein